MTDSKPRRVMILGLDGATLDLIRPWAEAGLLPTFQKLFRQGAWGKLRSTMPPLTPVAWSSFMTGVNPGKHGVFEFVSLEEDKAETSLVSANVRKAPSIWQLASRAGKQVIVYNVPVTYPPERVNGVMVSGLLTPDGAKDATYPRELQQELEQKFPQIVFSGHDIFEKGQEADFVEGLKQNHENNFLAAGYLMARQPWDLSVFVFQHTDSIGHFMWEHMEEKGKGLPKETREIAANAIQDIYRDVDTKLGLLIEAAGPDTHVLIMSDHGHGRLEWYFTTNVWLLEKGYIKLKQDAFTQFKYALFRLGITPTTLGHLQVRLGLDNAVRRASDNKAIKTKQKIKKLFLSLNDVDWSRTRAYALGYCGPIFVNLKGRQPHGIVEPGAEYEALLDQLTADLAAIKEPGTNSPLFPEIRRGSEFYYGPYADHGADLVYFPKNWRYLATGSTQLGVNHAIARGGKNKTGSHRMDGIFFLSGPGVQPGCELTGASILDVAPTTLALLGVDIPKEMDGRVLDEALAPELKAQLNVTYGDTEGLQPDLMPVEAMSAEDQDIMVARLRNLGYIA